MGGHTREGGRDERTGSRRPNRHHLEKEDPRIESQPDPGRLALQCSSGSDPATGRRRKRNLEQASLLHQVLPLEPGPPHRVGTRELSPTTASGRSEEDVGWFAQEVENRLDSSQTGENAAAESGAALSGAYSQTGENAAT